MRINVPTAVLTVVALQVAGFAVADSSAESSAIIGGSNSSQDQLSEVIVTAEKRGQERLLDVPVAITVVDAAELTSNSQQHLKDFYDQVPGLTLAPGPQSSNVLSIRGVTPFSGSATVGIVVDDIPFGTPGLIGATVVPDFDPGDLSQVDVLRGPQGTLYGASAMGGLIRFVTKEPSMDRISGMVQAGIGDTYNATGPNTNFRASINLPLSDALALRASGFVRTDAGYIDNPILGIRGINHERAEGAYLALAWKPLDGFSVKLSALYQDASGGGTADVQQVLQPLFSSHPPLGDLQQDWIAGVGPFSRVSEVFGLVSTYTQDRFNVVSSTAFTTNRYHDAFDASVALASTWQSLFGVSGGPVYSSIGTGIFTQELRVSFPVGSKVDAMVGGFFANEHKDFPEALPATNPLTGAVAGIGERTDNPQSYREFSGFTNLTIHPIDRLDVQVGARATTIRQTFSETESGAAIPIFYGVTTDTYDVPFTSINNSAVTYLFTPSYKFTPDTMAYVRLASGYRAGGPNAGVTGAIPTSYQPDKTYNYELGLKTELLQHALILDASAYLIDWRNIALPLVDVQLATSYTGNAASARSEGIELTAKWKATDKLTVSGWVDLAHAFLTANFPAAANAGGLAANAGDPLPWAPRISANLDADYEFHVTASATAFVGATEVFMGARSDLFSAPDANGNPLPRQPLPEYFKFDFRAGLKYYQWNFRLYGNNLCDRRGVLDGGPGPTSYPPGDTWIIQPRTVGLNVSRTF